MGTESERKCAGGCGRTLIFQGVHMGVPFALRKQNGLNVLVCSKCYDDITVDDHKVQRTGDEPI